MNAVSSGHYPFSTADRQENAQKRFCNAGAESRSEHGASAGNDDAEQNRLGPRAARVGHDDASLLLRAGVGGGASRVIARWSIPADSASGKLKGAMQVNTSRQRLEIGAALARIDSIVVEMARR